MSVYFLPGFLGTATEFGTVQTVTVTSTNHGNLSGLGNDDHPQYASLAQAETITGQWSHSNDILFSPDNTHKIGQSGGPGRPNAIHTVVLETSFANINEYADLPEIADPAAPPVNKARVWVRDVSTKTEIAARFNSGSIMGIVREGGGIIAPVIATASLPAAGAALDGSLIIEDAGAGDRNLIIYAQGQRFRIDGGASF